MKTKGSMFKQKFSAAIVTVLATLACQAALAETIAMSSIEEGMKITATTITLNSGSTIPVPVGEWRVLKKFTFKRHRPIGFDAPAVRLTLANLDEKSSLRFYSFAADLDSSSSNPTPFLQQCKQIPGGYGQGYELSVTEFDWACSDFRQYSDFKQTLISNAAGKDDSYAFGILGGFLSPILTDMALLKSLGNAPIVIQTVVTRNFDRSVFSTYGVATPPNFVLGDAPAVIQQLESLTRKSTRAGIASIRGESPMLKLPEVVIGESDIVVPKVVPEQPPLTLQGMLAFGKEQGFGDFEKGYVKFLALPTKDRVFMVSADGRDWMYASGLWPHTELLGSTTCKPHLKCRYLYVNDKNVWAESSKSLN